MMHEQCHCLFNKSEFSCWEGNKISSKYRGLGSIHDFVTMVHEKKCSTQQVHSWIRSHLCVCKYTPLSSLIKRVIWLSKLQSCKYTRPPKCRRNKILAGCLIGLTTVLCMIMRSLSLGWAGNQWEGRWIINTVPDSHQGTILIITLAMCRKQTFQAPSPQTSLNLTVWTTKEFKIE